MNVRTALVLFPVALACKSPEADYASDVARCELAPTCAEAVQCRTDAALKAGRDPKTTVGHCQ